LTALRATACRLTWTSTRLRTDAALARISREQVRDEPGELGFEVTELAAESSAGWLTVSELARVRGVDKAAISRRVARLEAAGALTTRPGPRGSKLIEASEFARAVEDLTDIVREANGRHGASGRDLVGAAPGDPILVREQARRTKIAADTAQLQFDALKGELVPISDFSDKVTVQGETLARVIDRIPDEAIALAGAEAKNGSAFAQALMDTMRSNPQGARSFFRILARNQRGAIADAFTALAQASAGETAGAPLENEMVD
jgi:DNA-binding transcriptional ArsR family regulator